MHKQSSDAIVSQAHWLDFRSNYETRILAGMRVSTRDAMLQSLKVFERIVEPQLLDQVNAETISEFIAKRRLDNVRVRNPENRRMDSRPISTATINRDLRHIKAFLKVAVQWHRIKEVPHFRYLKQPTKLPTYVPPDHFSAICDACKFAKYPLDIPNISPADWWRALLTTAILTGWSVGQILALKWTDIDLDDETAISMAEDNRGHRDIKISLHPIVIQCIRSLKGTSEPHVFTWTSGRMTLYKQFHDIQSHAVLKNGAGLPCGGKRGRRYGFNDLQRGFANAGNTIAFTQTDLAAEAYFYKRHTWAVFRKDYESKILAGMRAATRETILQSLKNFERVVNPQRVDRVKSETIAEFVSKRLQEFARGDIVEGKLTEKCHISVATVNKDLRVIKAFLRMAHEWGHLKVVPKIRFLKQPRKLPTFVPPEHFAIIYEACGGAKYPLDIPNILPADWWRALLTTAILTGWRIGQILALKWADVDLDSGTLTSMAEDNKGNADVKIPLHPIVGAHLLKLKGSFDPLVFPWNHGRNTLWSKFRDIQSKAVFKDGVPLPRGGKGGRRYGFHDLRRGFATSNAENIDLFRLQFLMQHKALKTTQGYVAMAKSLTRSIEGLFVPDILKHAGGPPRSELQAQ